MSDASKPTITLEQKRCIDEKLTQYGFHKESLVSQHVKAGTAWGHDFECLNDLDLDTLCRYLYAPDTVEIEMTVDERLLNHFDNATLYDESFVYEGQEAKAFKRGMRTALKIIGRQTPGITWDGDK